VDGANGYALVVYRLREEGEEAESVLSRHIAGSALSWTPSLEACLERGAQYAWSARAIGKKGPSAWSSPSLFQVASGPSEVEFEEALEIVRSYLETWPAPVAVAGESAAAKGGRAEPSRPEEDLISTSPPPAFQIPGSSGEVAVVGEVRTVDSEGEPRLWGRGRPFGAVYGLVGGYCSHQGVSFGLTGTVVTWEEAAEACPAGSWVCRKDDVQGSGSCNTGRPYDVLISEYKEYYGCDGTLKDFTSSQSGWLADAKDSYLFPLHFVESGGVFDTFSVCTGLPVWCCWE
jgi:hypothetical protein